MSLVQESEFAAMATMALYLLRTVQEIWPAQHDSNVRPTP